MPTFLVICGKRGEIEMTLFACSVEGFMIPETQGNKGFRVTGKPAATSHRGTFQKCIPNDSLIVRQYTFPSLAETEFQQRLIMSQSGRHTNNSTITTHHHST